MSEVKGYFVRETNHTGEIVLPNDYRDQLLPRPIDLVQHTVQSQKDLETFIEKLEAFRSRMEEGNFVAPRRNLFVQFATHLFSHAA